MAEEEDKVEDESPTSIFTSPYYTLDRVALPINGSTAALAMPADMAASFHAYPGTYIDYLNESLEEFGSANQIQDDILRLTGMAGANLPPLDDSEYNRYLFDATGAEMEGVSAAEDDPVREQVSGEIVPQNPTRNGSASANGTRGNISSTSAAFVPTQECPENAATERASGEVQTQYPQENNSNRAHDGSTLAPSSAVDNTRVETNHAPETAEDDMYDQALRKIRREEPDAFKILEDSKEAGPDDQELNAHDRIKSALNPGPGCKKNGDSVDKVAACIGRFINQEAEFLYPPFSPVEVEEDVLAKAAKVVKIPNENGDLIETVIKTRKNLEEEWDLRLMNWVDELKEGFKKVLNPRKKAFDGMINMKWRRKINNCKSAAVNKLKKDEELKAQRNLAIYYMTRACDDWK